MHKLECKVGDLVRPIHGSGTFLRSGGSAYDRAVVINTEPLHLASESGDMLWTATVEGMALEVCGEAAPEALQRALARSPNLCPNGCGQPGPHFVPPSLGEPGFYLCKPLVEFAPPVDPMGIAKFTAAAVRFRMYPSPTLTLECKEVTTLDRESLTPAFVEECVKVCVLARGYAVAAPQIGVARRFFVTCVHAHLGLEEPRIWINPRIVEASPEMVCQKEGCLSIIAKRAKNRFAMLSRPAWVLVEYQTADGVVLTHRCEGMLARVVQHEIDHLDGVLFFTRLSPIERPKIEAVLREMTADARARR